MSLGAVWAGAPIRVAQVMGKMVGGGVEAVVMNYYRHIDRDAVQFDFLVDEDSTLVPRGEIERLGGRVIEVPPYQDLPIYSKTLECLFSSEDYPIVHSHVNALSVFPLRAAKRVGVPVRIAHSHSTSGKGEIAKNVLKVALKTQANRYPTHRFACSEYAGRWLFGERANFEVIRNAVDLTRFRFESGTRAQVRAELGLADGTFVVGHIGRFMPQKNHLFLIDAFAELVSVRSDSVLVCVGDGELRPFVERRAAERGVAGRVRFLGQREDADRLYSAFDAFVLPSLYEGLGLVGIEAQVAGLPCFLSDVIPREVDVTGTVRFFPIDDSKMWANALCALKVGGRMSVRIEDFGEYDIGRAAQSLTGRYIELLKGIEEE